MGIPNVFCKIIMHTQSWEWAGLFKSFKHVVTHLMLGSDHFLNGRNADRVPVAQKLVLQRLMFVATGERVTGIITIFSRVNPVSVFCNRFN